MIGSAIQSGVGFELRLVGEPGDRIHGRNQASVAAKGSKNCCLYELPRLPQSG
jgi:hypothetical protein